ncbi:hypothetical protein [Brevibacillus laterosporus]|uniref:hypothetical protein n=1 Tax=Brevibacillus laterosporus TaxID=1465 RepID=UPI00264FF40B|nr:hypothetical protein [Brevibacillus laterosporus]MDN9012723.1 hypothetical protein [Brevibacillus laterosporus]MDO0943852.1 hypothetical protein [Brevibacillus laterosporus]
MNFSLEINAIAKLATIVIGGIGSLVLPWTDFLFDPGRHHLLIALSYRLGYWNICLLRMAPSKS